jgi:tetratricopeptide (TPR) repeat protein
LSESYIVRAVVSLLLVAAFLSVGSADAKVTKELRHAQKLYFSGKYDEAVTELTKLIQQQSTDSELYLERSAAYDALGKRDLAVQDLTEAIRLDPKDSEQYLKRALLYKALNNDAAALGDFNEAIKLNPKLASWRASFMKEKGNHHSAIEDYTKAIAAHRGTDKAMQLSNRAMVYAELDHHRKAINDMNEAIKLEPSRAEFYSNRGSCHFGVSDFKKSIQDFSEAIRRNPKDPENYFRRAEAEASDGQKQAALKDYDEAIKLQTDKAAVADYHYRRAMVLSDMRRYDDAIVDLSKAMEIEPDNADFVFERGVEYRALEKWKEADVDFSKAIELRPEFSAAFKHRAIVRSKLGNTEGAIADLKTAMSQYGADKDNFGVAEVSRMIARMENK